MFLALRFLCLTLLALAASAAHADCTGPAATAGTVFYNTSYNVIQYCNGSNWINTGNKNAAATNTGCTNPTGTRGQVFFNTTANVHQFCNGEAWQNMACSRTATSSGTACTNPIAPRGTLSYVTPANKLQICDGTKWLNTGVSCGPDPCTATSLSVGTICADGSVYAGISSDGNQRMFTTRCNAGRTWNGSTCTGSSYADRWGPMYTTTGYSNSNTGKSNSAGLYANYSSQALAARYCEELTMNGKTDWYLPARTELDVFYTNINLIGGFDTSEEYWSSTEVDSDRAISQRFNDGGLQTTPKSSPRYVRCARWN